MQAELLRALARHPEARRDVVELFRRLERQPPQLIEIQADAGKAA